MKQMFVLSALLVFVFAAMMGCSNSGPVKIHYGQDQCDYCSMNIVDNSFGTQMVTAKGKALKFDSIECLAAFQVTSEGDELNSASSWVTDFSNAGTFVRIDSATIVFSEQYNSPMGVGLLGFSSFDDANSLVAESGGRAMNWNEVRELVKTRWKL